MVLPLLVNVTDDSRDSALIHVKRSVTGLPFEISLEVGRMSGEFQHAEGWRRHSHLGFSQGDHDPLAEALGPHYRINQAYEDALNAGVFPR